ncbi:Squamosa promoter-binding-like protein 2 [Forsythia ovata]|uniref:Squamosa promoter-binding-like protein 2 n=1 Tax=Forsythia ovata TaxID=205694 RepID=A0ABD1Q0N9_9LAMI
MEIVKLRMGLEKGIYGGGGVALAMKGITQVFIDFLKRRGLRTTPWTWFQFLVYFNLSANGGNSVTSGSYAGRGSSTKSSISASTDSFLKDGIKLPSFEFDTFEGSANFIKKIEMARFEVSGTSPPLKGSIGFAEPYISLKLRKWTNFENNVAGSNVESITTSIMPTSSTTTMKKTNHLVELANKLSHVQPLCNNEMVVGACKHILPMLMDNVATMAGEKEDWLVGRWF